MKMLKRLKNQQGFSLVEVMVSMAIFVTFTSILINSYSSIVQAQREANEFRIMYVEARQVFEGLSQEFRDGMIDYEKMANFGADLLRGQRDVHLVSKDGRTKTRIYYEDKKVKMTEGRVSDPRLDPVDKLTVDLNTDAVKISDFAVFISPSIDPYNPKFVSYDINQFHPKVTIYAEFQRQGRGNKIYEFDLQTTVSSRLYNQVYATTEPL